VIRLDGTSDPVLAIHGVSSNNRLWGWLHDAAPWATLVAPDLPGRGDAAALSARPSSLAALADHLASLGLGRVHVLGMSLGGFVAVALAARHPELVRTLTLVDGGLPVAQLRDAEALRGPLRAQYADATDWPSVAAYAEHYVATAAPLVDPADPRLLALCAHDLARGENGGPVRRHLDTVVEDALDVFCTEHPAEALGRVEAPVELVHAQWSVGRDSAPMYEPDHVARFDVAATLVEGVDHAGTVMTERGAAACAAALERSLSRPT
jgi:pimeloyl-ACP methyl ester carboxylesterase